MKFRPLVKLILPSGEVFLKNIDYSVTSPQTILQVQEWVKSGSAIPIGGIPRAGVVRAVPKSFFQRLLDRIKSYGRR